MKSHNTYSQRAVNVVDLITLAIPFFASIAFIIKMITRWGEKDDMLMFFYLSVAISTALVRLVFVIMRPTLIGAIQSEQNPDAP